MMVFWGDTTLGQFFRRRGDFRAQLRREISMHKVAPVIFSSTFLLTILAGFSGGLAYAQEPATRPDASPLTASEKQSLNDQANQLNAQGMSYSRSGDFSGALGLFQSELSLRTRASEGRDTVLLAQCLNNVAACLDLLGRSAEALPMYQASLEMYKRVYGDPDNPDVARSLNNVAYCLYSLGRSGEALPIYQSSLEMYQRIYKNQDNPDVARSLNNIALCLNSLGRSAAALPVCQAAMEMYERIYKDQDHPYVALSQNNVAFCLQSLGRSDEALPMFQAVMEMYKRIYKGRDHPYAALSVNNVGYCLQSLGRGAEALTMFQAALEMNKRIYGEQDHPDVATDLNNVGVCLQSLGRSAEALPAYQAALTMRKRIYKDHDHPNVATSLDSVAECLDSLGRSAEALPMDQAAVSMAERLSDPNLYRWSGTLAHLYMETKDFSAAARDFQTSIDALEKARESLGGDDTDRLSFMTTAQAWDPYGGMVRAQLWLNQPERAAEYLDQSKGRIMLDILERAERQSGGDILKPAEDAAIQSRDEAALDRIRITRQALAAADNEVEELTAAIGQARSMNNAEGRSRINLLKPKLIDARRRSGDAHREASNIAGALFAKPIGIRQMQSLLHGEEHLLLYS
ncbi:MAG: tetratricopeptide repeat protein, partial [Verrucomicrobiota bacterium]